MDKLTVVAGLILIGLGVAAYQMSPSDKPNDATGDRSSQVADQPARQPVYWVPAVAGGLLVLFGGLSITRPGMRMHAMHGAVTVALLGGLYGLVRSVLLIGNGIDTVGWRVMLLLGLATVICWGLVVLCVRSFIAARRRRDLASE